MRAGGLGHSRGFLFRPFDVPGLGHESLSLLILQSNIARTKCSRPRLTSEFFLAKKNSDSASLRAFRPSRPVSKHRTTKKCTKRTLFCCQCACQDSNLTGSVPRLDNYFVLDGLVIMLNRASSPGRKVPRTFLTSTKQLRYFVRVPGLEPYRFSTPIG